MTTITSSASAALDALTEAFPFATRTIPQLLNLCAAKAKRTGFLDLAGTTYAASDLLDRAARTASLLRDEGVEASDRVAILCGNRIQFLDLFFGCAWLGAVAVPINRSSRGAQLEHILRNSGARLLAIDADTADVLDHLDRATLAVRRVWLLPSAAPADVATIADWAAIPMPKGGIGIEAVAAAPSDTAAILYTSGTTGPSKGVCCPHAQFFWWGAHSIDILEIGSDDVLLTSLPLFHVNALSCVFQALLADAKLVVQERFSASGFVPALHRHGATITYLLGAMVPILLASEPSDADRSHRVVRALAPGVPARAGEQFTARFGIGLIEGYGSTETNFVIGDRLADQVAGTMGRVRPGYDARVFDDQDIELPDGTPGELVIRSDLPFSTATGYFEMPDATLASRRNLWFHTGDRVYRTREGHFVFMDRMKDAIRRRGENISAYEVEQVLLSHPAVANAAVFPVASDLAEDEVMASVVLREGALLDAPALLDFCQPRMTYFSVPRYVRFVDTLPATDNGKVQKFKLRATGVTPDTWDRERAGYQVRRPQRPVAA